MIPPAVARANGLVLSRHAPHPHAALLYCDFMIGALTGTPRIVVDPALFLDHADKRTDLCESIFIPARR